MKHLKTFKAILTESAVNEGKSAPENFKEYEELCKSYPHFKQILEDLLGTAPRYAIHDIRDNDNRVVFYFHQSLAISSSICDFMKKYEISIQVPGNQSYTFSVSINKK